MATQKKKKKTYKHAKNANNSESTLRREAYGLTAPSPTATFTYQPIPLLQQGDYIYSRLLSR